MRYFLLLFLILLAGCSPDSSNTPGPTPAVDSSPNGFMAQVATTYQDADIYQDPVNMTQFIVMGDNRPISSDSREFGPLHESELIALIKHSPTPPRIARPILTNYLAILKQPSYLAIKLDHE
jgi:hypothetical protein